MQSEQDRDPNTPEPRYTTRQLPGTDVVLMAETVETYVGIEPDDVNQPYFIRHEPTINGAGYIRIVCCFLSPSWPVDLVENISSQHEGTIISFLEDYCREKGARMRTWHNRVAGLSWERSTEIEEQINLAVWGR